MQGRSDTPGIDKAGAEERRTGAVLALLVLSGFVIRVFLAARVPVIEPDGAFYARLAEEILSGSGSEGFHPAWPPLYPWLIAAFAGPIRLLSGGEVPSPFQIAAAGRQVNCVIGALLPLVAWRIGRRLGGGGVGIAAAVLTAFHPRLLVFSTQVLTEMPFAFFCTTFFLFLGTLLLSPSKDRGRGRAAVLAGGAAGLAYLTRPEGVILAFAGLAGLLLSPGDRGRRLGVALALALSFGVITAPHAVRVSRSVGYVTIGAKSDYNLALAYSGEPGVPAIDRSRSTYNNLTGGRSDSMGSHVPRFEPDPIPRFPFVSFALERPLTVLRHAARQLPYSAGALLSLAQAPFVLLALFGVFARRPRAREEITWLLFWIALVTAYALVFVFRRFLAAALPLLLVESAAGLVFLTRSKPKLLVPALLLLAGYGFAAGWKSVASEPYPVEQMALVREMSRRDEEGTKEPGSRSIMARKPIVAFYTGSPILAMADVEPGLLPNEARARHATHVVIDERDLVRERPAYRRLLAPEAAWMDHSGLRPEAVAGAEPHRVVLFRVIPPSLNRAVNGPELPD